MSIKKNILFVEYCSDLKAGGAQRVFLNILRSIDTTKYNIFAAFPHSFDSDLAVEIPDHIISFDYDSKSPDSSQNKLLAYCKFVVFIPFIFLRWFFLIKKHEVKVVYVHSVISGFHFSLLACFLNIKLIYHEHNMASQRPTMILWKWLFDFVTYKASKIIAISNDVADDLIKFGAESKKVEVIHNGIELIEKIDCEQLKLEGIKRLSINKNNQELLVGMVGHFRPWKGQKIFVESLIPLLEKNISVHYVLIGGIHDQGYYEEVVDFINVNKLSEYVTLTGHQGNIPELMACLDIVVVPSIPEPFGLVLLEAMMVSKPVVAFNIGGPAEIVIPDSTGILVQDTNSNALSEAIKRLIESDEKRISMGQQGRELLEEKFTSHIQCQNIEKLIDGFFHH